MVDRLRDHNKRCSRCSWLKPVAEFQASPLTNDGKQSWCKACKATLMRLRRADGA